MIITQDGGVDIVPDRTDFVGSDFARDCLRRHLEAKFPPMTLIDSISDRLRDGQIRTREATDVVLYEDDRASVVGNSNASAGYFYVSAWLKP
jgi:hypothetical protein